MAVGFVLITAVPKREHDVHQAMLEVPAVVEVYPLFGEFDLIAKLEAMDFDELGHIIVTQVRSIDGVQDTKTLTGTSL